MARKKRKRPHGMGSVYQRGPGNFWIKWRENGRVRYAHGYATRELADRVLAKIVADLAAGRAGLPPDPKGLPTLAALADDWLDRRKLTHRSAKDDVGRWNNHLKAHFGNARPTEVDAAGIRRFVEAKLAEGLNSNTVGNCVRLLSTFFSDVVERGLAPLNPVRGLPRSTRRLYRPTTDPRTTPFLEKLEDVRRIFLALPEQTGVAFAIGAFAGLRTGEVLGLQWSDVDLKTRRIHVQRQMQNGEIVGLKDDESRSVPIVKALAPVLAAWKIKTGGTGSVLLPRMGHGGGRPGAPPAFMRPHTLHAHLRAALEACKLPEITWYQATRHTFASQWVLNGLTIEKLSKVMGHSSVLVTERYAHLRGDLFREAELNVLDVDLARGGATVAKLRTKASVGASSKAVAPRRSAVAAK